MCHQSTSKNINNFKNPPKSLAFRRQCSWLNAVLRKDHIRNNIEIHSVYYINVNEVQHERIFIIVQPGQNRLCVTDQIVIHGTEYRKDSFLKISSDAQGYKFAHIRLIVWEDLSNTVLVLMTFDTMEFDQHSYCYKITPTFPEENLVSGVDGFLDHHPLDKTYEITYVAQGLLCNQFLQK